MKIFTRDTTSYLIGYATGIIMLGITIAIIKTYGTSFSSLFAILIISIQINIAGVIIAISLPNAN